MKRIGAALFLILAICLPAAAGSFASLSIKAEKAERKGDAALAIEQYTTALRMWESPDGRKSKAKVLAARGWLYAKTGSPDKAMADISAALKLDANNSVLYFRKGRIRLDEGKTSDAISSFYKAAKLNLNYREAYFYRGLAYEKQGDMQFAKEDYKTACKLGMKAACSAAARAKVSTSVSSEGEAFEAATPQSDKQTAVEVKAKRKKAAYKLDWKACLDSLNSCVDAGGAFGDCVKQSKKCEDAPAAGCCPKDCIQRYNESVDQSGMSEAEAYRTVFVEKPDCVKP